MKSTSSIENIVDMVNRKKQRYHGQWRNGTMNGKGSLYSCGKLVYEGSWQEGKREGFGIKYFLNKHEFLSRYEGYWKNNLRDGEGCLVFRNGCYYVGSFKNGRMEGFGYLYNQRGFKFSGSNWKNGEVDEERLDFQNEKGSTLFRIPKEVKQRKIINPLGYTLPDDERTEKRETVLGIIVKFLVSLVVLLGVLSFLRWSFFLQTR